MPAQIRGVDLAPYISGGLKPFEVNRHRWLRHAHRRRKLGGVGVLVDLGQHEQLLGVESQRREVGLDGADY